MDRKGEDQQVAPSLWLDVALAADDDDLQRLDGDLRVDACIVGGGYAGLWTALELKRREPSLEVAIIERTICGGGASGRNSGFLLGWWRGVAALQACCGVEEGLRLARAAAGVADSVEEFCRENAIDAEFRRTGWLWASTNPRPPYPWTRIQGLLDRYGHDVYQPVDHDELEQLTGTQRFTAGVIDRGGVSVQPAMLARGLRRAALASGVRVFEWSPMVALERSRPPRVVTNSGVITAEMVILTMNAWLQQIREVARSFFAIAGDMIATVPNPKLAEASAALPGVSDARLHVRGARTTADGRIVYGLGGTVLLGPRGRGSVYAGVVPPRRANAIRASFGELYPRYAGLDIARTWTGPVDKSVTGLPFFGRLGGHPEILYAAGFSGNGVGPTHLAGRMLAAMALRADDEWAHSADLLPPRGGLPPEPVRYLGGRIVKAAVAHSERVREHGAEPGWFTRSLAARVPGGNSGGGAVTPRDSTATPSQTGERIGGA